MNQINALKVFIKVTEFESFIGAADALDLSSTAVSRMIKELENHVGAQLLNRSTRSVHLTTKGRIYLKRAKQLIADLQEMDGDVSNANSSPKGNLRVTATTVFIRDPFFRIIDEYLRRYPEVNLEIDYLDRIVDLGKEEYDLGIRLLLTIEDNMIASKLGVSQPVVVASPKYLKENGYPDKLDSLLNHQCIIDSNWSDKNDWAFLDNKEAVTQKVQGRFSVNNGEAARLAALKGLGISYLPSIFVADDIADGKLEVLLKPYQLEPVSIYAAYPSNRYLRKTVTSFVEFLRERLQVDRWDHYTRTPDN